MPEFDIDMIVGTVSLILFSVFLGLFVASLWAGLTTFFGFLAVDSFISMQRHDDNY